LLLEGPAFSRKRWHYVLYMEQRVAGRICFLRKRWRNILYMERLVAGTTRFLQQALAQHSLHGAACCWNYPISSAGVGTIFLTWSSLSLELPDFFSKRWHYILDME